MLQTLTIGVNVPRPTLFDRVSRRVDEQFERGVVDEVRRLVAQGVPLSAHAFSGLVYRQVVDHLNGVRDLAATRELIVRENMRYAKRQVTWFRKEPGVTWLDAPGETPGAKRDALAIVEKFLAPRLSLEAWPHASSPKPVRYDSPDVHHP